MTISKSRITSGNIDDLLEDTSKVNGIGHALLRQGYIKGSKFLMKTPHKKMKFESRINPLLLTEEKFLDIVDEFLSNNGMYLTNARVYSNWYTNKMMGFTCYRLEGKLYEELG